MNIFFLDLDTKKSAEYHCDKHVVKMCLETAQLLCSTHWVLGGEAPYKLAHKNHPCSIWTRESLSNYRYLCEFGLNLCQEYEYRYGKVHKCKQVIEWCIDNEPLINDLGMTKPALAMPDEYKSDCAIQSYRNYYNGAKLTFAKWKNRDIPNWIIN